MKSGGIARQVVAVFFVALTLYFVTYTAIEHRRNRNGPWEVTFTNDVAGAPAIRIDQPRLAITNVLIVFTNAPIATNAATVITFERPRLVPFDVPHGHCIFMDTTFLPGTIVFEMFGHEVQLIPRVLTIDKQEQPWRGKETISLPVKSGPAVRSAANLDPYSGEKRR
jgi:hypothetical protein